MKTWISFLFVASITITIHAAPATAPKVTVDVIQPKILRFKWEPVPDATYYRLYRDSDGLSGFKAVGRRLKKTNTIDVINLHSHNWARARYIVKACNSSGCRASAEVSTRTLKTAAMQRPMPGHLNYTPGRGLVSANGKVMANFDPHGSVIRIYKLGTMGWTLYQSLKPVGGIRFKTDAVALSANGRILAVGGSDYSEYRGKVTLFEDSSGNYSPKQVLSAPNANVTVYGYWDQLKSDWADFGANSFGDRLALSFDGSTLAVAAPREGGGATGVNGNNQLLAEVGDKILENPGAVWVYRRNLSGWAEEAYIKPTRVNNLPEGAFQDTQISLSAYGNSLVVSGRVASSNENWQRYRGALPGVFVYNRSGTTWSSGQVITDIGQGLDSLVFGLGPALFHTQDVQISSNGTLLAVGYDAFSPVDDTQGNFMTGRGGVDVPTGHVVLYAANGNQWVRQATLRSPTARGDYGDRFGRRLAIASDGKSLLVAAPAENNLTTGNTSGALRRNGAVHIFSMLEGRWTRTTSLRDPLTAPANISELSSDFGFGLQIAGSGDLSTLLISSGAAGPQLFIY